jgi:tRNA(Arg) A34 adenosine deaminase TadA
MNKKFMLSACGEAKKGLETVDAGPFGACIVKEGQVCF